MNTKPATPDLTMLYECGNVQLSLDETSVYTGIKKSTIVDDSNMCEAYLQGRLDTEIEARRHIVAAVRNGDIAACQKLLQLAEKSRPELEDDDAED